MKRFQQENGLGADGICGAMTWNRLCPTVATDYVYWRKEKAIAEVQQILADEELLDPSQIDGLFGWRTENAIKAFQQKYALPVDGRFGRQGWSVVESLKVSFTETND